MKQKFEINIVTFLQERKETQAYVVIWEIMGIKYIVIEIKKIKRWAKC